MLGLHLLGSEGKNGIIRYRLCFFFQAEDGIRDKLVTGVQTCALPIYLITHLIDYMRSYTGNAEVEWVMAQAAGKGKFADNHPSPDYIAGVLHFANGVRGDRKSVV